MHQAQQLLEGGMYALLAGHHCFLLEFNICPLYVAEANAATNNIAQNMAKKMLSDFEGHWGDQMIPTSSFRGPSGWFLLMLLACVLTLA
jgi:hypothetical protein